MYAVYLTIYYGDKLPPFYIGSSSIKKIENGYCGSIRSKKYKDIFYEEIKYNKHLFEVIIISTHNTRSEAINFELELQKYFDVVKSYDFFNEAFASINGMFGRDVSGSSNPMYGKKHTENTKKVLSEKRGVTKRFEITDEFRDKISKIHKGKTRSDETKNKISEAKKGNKYWLGKIHSDETKNKISEAKKGKTHSEETKQKISEISKDKVISKETKQKISKSKKGKKREAFSEEWKQNLSNSKKGKIMSEEAKQKLIQSKTGMKYKESICPYCNKKGGGGNMVRYHFENCKFKNK
jgi:hypothetical protein